MKRSILLCLVQIVFLAGILISSAIFKHKIFWFQAVYVPVILFVVFWFVKISFRWHKTLLIVFLLALVRFLFEVYWEDQQSLKNYNNPAKEITVYGCIIEDVDWRRDNSKLTVGAFAVSLAQGTVLPVEGKLLVKTERYHNWKYGDCLSVEGKMQLPGEIDDFSYEDYLRRYGIFSVMYDPKIKALEVTKGEVLNQAAGDFWSYLYEGKAQLEHRLNTLLHDPYASLAAGLLTGSRRGINESLTNDFNKTGLSHIVAVSGYNITLLIGLVFSLFSFLSKRYRVLVSFLFIVVFTLFVGASAAVVRASVMGVIALLALQFGRKTVILLALLSSAVWMCFFNPYILMFDVGFQLSFSATLGLVLFADKIGVYLKKVPNWFGARESLTMTLAAQVFTGPIIIWQFGRFSLIAPLANILIAPLLPVAMLFSFLSVVVSHFWNFGATSLAYIAWMFLWLIVKTAQVLALLPWASVEI